MPRTRLTEAARADLHEIRRYSLRVFGTVAADAYLRHFKAVFALLRERPMAGVARDDVVVGLRCFTHRRHRVFYRVDGGDVLVVRVLHHARQTPGAFE